jgi:uncharacterized protein YcbX
MTSSSHDVQGRIAQMFVYPVKSCAGIAVDAVSLTEMGLAWDRAWMVVDEAGEFVTQREAAALALVQPRLDAATQSLVLSAPGCAPLSLPVGVMHAATRARVWKDEVPAWDMGEAAARWFTAYLSRTTPGLAPAYRLVRFDTRHRRLSSLQWTQGVEAPNQFSDGYPVLVLSLASMAGLNARLQAAGHAPVGIERFRANVIVQDWDEHDEDRVGPMTIDTEAGEVVLTPVKPCPRCPVPNIDPATARSSPEVGDTLQTYRQDARVNGAVTFGMNTIASVGVGRVLRVGQRVAADFRFE